MTGAEIARLRSDGALLRSIVSHTVALKKIGREWKGLCPFHNEKTPSFNVFADGHYHCFGCQAHGTVFDFVMQAERIDFPEACRRVAAEAVISPPKHEGNGMHKGNLWQPMMPPHGMHHGRPISNSPVTCFIEYCGANDNPICYVRRCEAKRRQAQAVHPAELWHAERQARLARQSTRATATALSA